tara:strand:- start:97 stop:498 length:402 start_codon:yes stop_codon:yes gene_type:complete
MTNATIITDTLEQVAKRCGDPKERVFKRLYELDPKFEPLFVMDTDGGVRGSMLETSLNCMIGVAQGESQTPRLLIEAARMIHDGYGLTEDEVDFMFVAMRDVFRDVMAGDWTPEVDSEWTKLLAELATIRAET